MMRSGRNKLGLVLPLLILAGCAADQQVEVVLESAPEVAGSTEQNGRKVEVAPERWAKLKAEIREAFPGVDQLSTEELKRLLERGDGAPLLLDVREADEFVVSHLEHARLATNEDEALSALGKTPLDRKIVLYCSVGYRSSALAEKLKARGYTNVFNLEGSIFEWANNGDKIYADGRPVRSVHPYDSDWGRLLRSDYWSDMGDSEE